MEIYRPQIPLNSGNESERPGIHSPLRDDAYVIGSKIRLPFDYLIPKLATEIKLIDRRTNVLDLTDFWDPGVYAITPIGGSVQIHSSLFIEKDTVFNYGYRAGAPEGISTLMWNSIESIYEFGSLNLKPGDSIVFTEEIDMGDKLLPGESKHGEGYFGTTNGMCNASTTLSELFGTRIQLPGGSIVPLFIAKPGDIQPHDMDHNPLYYEYAYHGPGVAVNNTEKGNLPFMVNPNLPQTLRVQLSMSFTDTNPSNSYNGLYKPTASVVLNGLPNGSTVIFQRLSANRTYLLQKVTGSQEYYLPKATSAYFDKKGVPIRSKTPIVFETKQSRKIPIREPVMLTPQTNMLKVQLGRFHTAFGVPTNMVNELFYPGGYAHRSTKDKEGKLIWKAKDDSLPLNPEDLPTPMASVSSQEYFRILSWNNVSNPNNIRYKLDSGSGTSYCNVVVLDWAQAYRLAATGESVPLPRWLKGTKVNSNILYSWLYSYQAEALGWKKISAIQASKSANSGYFTLVIAKNTHGSGHVAAVAPGVGWTSPEGVYYPITAQAGFENWGPEAGKTVYDSFKRVNSRTWGQPEYFVWDP